MADFALSIDVYNPIFVNKIVYFQKNEVPCIFLTIASKWTKVSEKLHLTRKKEQVKKSMLNATSFEHFSLNNSALGSVFCNTPAQYPF